MYIFKHALIQEAAYQSLLKSTRQRHHQQVARVLEERFPGDHGDPARGASSSLYGGGLSEQAIPYWQRAGERAIQRSAYVEAIGHLTSGLEVLADVAGHPCTAPAELGLQITLGRALKDAKGNAAPEVGQAYSTGPGAVSAGGRTAAAFPVLLGCDDIMSCERSYRPP